MFRFNPYKNVFDVIRSFTELDARYYTQSQVDDLIAVENTWDRSAETSTLTPHNANDNVNLGSGDITTTGVGIFNQVNTNTIGLSSGYELTMRILESSYVFSDDDIHPTSSNQDLGTSIKPFQNLHLSGNIDAGGDIFADQGLFNGNVNIASTLTLDSGSIIDSTGAISFGDENLTTTGLGTFGNLDVDTLNFNGNIITDSGGTINVTADVELGGYGITANVLSDGTLLISGGDLTTTGDISCNTLYATNDVRVTDDIFSQTLTTTHNIWAGDDIIVDNVGAAGIILKRGGVTMGSITTASDRMTLNPEDGGGVVIQKNIDNSATDPYASVAIWGATNSDSTTGSHIPIRYTLYGGEYALLDIKRPADNEVDFTIGFRTSATSTYTEALRVGIDSSNNKEVEISGDFIVSGDGSFEDIYVTDVKGTERIDFVNSEITDANYPKFLLEGRGPETIYKVVRNQGTDNGAAFSVIDIKAENSHSEVNWIKIGAFGGVSQASAPSLKYFFIGSEWDNAFFKLDNVDEKLALGLSSSTEPTTAMLEVWGTGYFDSNLAVNGVLSLVDGAESSTIQQNGNWLEIDKGTGSGTIMGGHTLIGDDAIFRKVGLNTPQIALTGHTPSIFQSVQRDSTSGFAFDMFNLNAKSTTTGLDADVGKIGFLGNFGGVGVDPYPTYIYMGATVTTDYNNAVLKIDAEDRIGIGITGTDRPTELLHLSSATDGVKQLIQTLDSTDGKYTGLVFKVSDTVYDGYNKGGIFFERTDTSGRGTLHLVTTNVEGSTNIDLTTSRLSVDKDGITKIGDATNYAEIKADGEINLHGTGRVKRHVWAGAASFRPSGAVEAGQGINTHLVFRNNFDDEGYYSTHVPYRWAVGTDIEIQLKWYYTGANDNNNCEWNLTYLSVAEGEDPTAAGTALTEITTAIATADTLGTTTFTIPAAALATHDNLFFKIWRDGSDALAASALLLGAHIHFTMDKLGQTT